MRKRPFPFPQRSATTFGRATVAGRRADAGAVARTPTYCDRQDAATRVDSESRLTDSSKATTVMNELRPSGGTDDRLIAHAGGSGAARCPVSAASLRQGRLDLYPCCAPHLDPPTRRKGMNLVQPGLRRARSNEVRACRVRWVQAPRQRSRDLSPDARLLVHALDAPAPTEGGRATL